MVAPSNSPKYFCEFCATACLVFVVPMSVGCGTTLVPILVGFTVCALIYAIGPVSGGHLNPALTLALFLDNPAAMGSPVNAVLYMLSQLSGGLVGGLLAGATTYRARQHAISGKGMPGTQLVLSNNEASGFTLFDALLAEFLGTAFMLFVGMQVSAAQSNQYYAIAIGFMVAVCVQATALISGAGLNPALTLGVNVAADLFLPSNSFAFYTLERTPLFIVAQVLGGLLASRMAKTAKLPDRSRARQTVLIPLSEASALTSSEIQLHRNRHDDESSDGSLVDLSHGGTSTASPAQPA